LELADKSHLLTAQIMADLHAHWTPHSGQVKALKGLINKTHSVAMIQCGRKWGKTDIAEYALWRWALLHPGSVCYYVAPELKHGRELIWNNNRLVRFGQERDKHGRPLPGGKDSLKKYIKSVNQTESRLRLNNGSQIVIVGSENWSAANGLTPDFAVYDEFKVFKRQWHTEFNPNRIVREAPLMVIGTPPKPGDCNKQQYIELADQAREREDMFHIEASSYENPHVPRHAIDAEIEILKQRGELDVIEREYYGRLVYGGASAIFPMLSRERHVRPHAEIIQEIKRDLKKLEWYCVTDPGTTTCFAALFAAVNPYTKKIYILDEIYETDQNETSVRSIYPRLDAKMGEFYPTGDIDDDWFKVYDEAAAWFSAEVLHQYGTSFFPTQKHMHKKEHGLSIIKDTLLHDLVVISDRCTKLYWEAEQYAKDDKGNIPKMRDHAIDCWRYLIAAANYNMLEVLEIIKQRNDYDRRAFSLREEADSWHSDNDWTKSFTKHWDLGE